MSVFIDTNVFVYAAAKVAKTIPALNSIEKARENGAYTSPLVVDEVIWVLRGRKEEQNTAVNNIKDDGRIEVLAVHAQAGFEAFELMKKHGLKPRDAIHVAVMKKNGIKTILSDDPDFDKVPGIKRVKL